VVPPPKVDLLRYHGVVAPNYKFRSLIVPELPAESDDDPDARCRRQTRQAGGDAAGDDIARRGAEDGAVSPERQDPCRGDAPRVPGVDRAPATLLARYLDWAQLLARVYAVDVLACRRCGGRMKVVAFLTESDVTRKIRNHLDLPSVPPEPRPGRTRDPTPGSRGWGDEWFVDPPGFDS
jgi:hypothetical protein